MLDSIAAPTGDLQIGGRPLREKLCSPAPGRILQMDSPNEAGGEAMRHANTIGVSLIWIGSFLCVAPVQAQSDQQPSVAEAARKARAQKKSERPVPVVDNDTLKPPTEKPEVTSATAVEATLPGAPASTPETATPDAKATVPDDAKKNEEEQKALEELKQQIREMKKEVDLAQRALSLANEDFYSKPDFANNTDGKAKLDALVNELTQKKDELTQLLAQLPAGESADEPKPSAPQPQ